MDLADAADLLDRLQPRLQPRATRVGDRHGPVLHASGPPASFLEAVADSPIHGGWFARSFLGGSRPVALVAAPFGDLPAPSHLAHDWLNNGGEPSGDLIDPGAPGAAHRWDAATRRNSRSRLAVVNPATAPATPDGAHAVVVGALAADYLATHLDALASTRGVRQGAPWRREADAYRAYFSAATTRLDALTAPWADDAGAMTTATPDPNLPRGFAVLGTT